ncbi:uncharacterized protein LOC132733588 [Ruditapes philippinarum]|uniref:uncharacterized protein LOC132733588 n=1 Tax=Ruditapes philippinarum TaxID=129788 RepID=UPI00295A6FCD|nr:uncharacterized protein LOC132733588 [Ruditapes philippinarum]
MKRLTVYLVFGLIQIGILEASVYCRNKNYKPERLYCDDGCCGSWPYETCCDETYWYGWAVVGGVIAAIFIIGLSICGVCLLIKVRGKKGRLINPSQSQNHMLPVYASTISQTTPYPVGHGHVTTIIQNPLILPELPPSYQTLYGHQHDQQQYWQQQQDQHHHHHQQQQPPIFLHERLPPIPIGLRGQGYTQM